MPDEQDSVGLAHEALLRRRESKCVCNPEWEGHCTVHGWGTKYLEEQLAEQKRNRLPVERAFIEGVKWAHRTPCGCVRGDCIIERRIKESEKELEKHEQSAGQKGEKGK